MSSTKQVARVKTIETSKSLATNFSSSHYSIPFLDNVGVLIKTASVTDNTGTFIIEATIDDPNLSTAEWVDIEISPLMTLADTNTSFMINLNQLPFEAIRVSFTAAGSTPDGTCEIRMMSKRI